jgi:hypothetical protein
MRNFTGAALLLFCAATNAFEVDLDPGDSSKALGIFDLDIQGTAYDVIFEYSEGPHDGRQAGDIFIDEAGATAATNAISAALNSVSTIQGIGQTQDNRFLVPWQFDTNDCVDQGPGTATCAWEGRLFGGSWNDSFHELDSVSSDVPVELARFSAAVVPIPAAAWLFGSALGILVFIRKRTLQTAA